MGLIRKVIEDGLLGAVMGINVHGTSPTEAEEKIERLQQANIYWRQQRNAYEQHNRMSPTPISIDGIKSAIAANEAEINRLKID